jgi:predicted RNase H-like nuclease
VRRPTTSLRVGGADGCPGGWIVAVDDSSGAVGLQLVPEAAALLGLDLDVLTIDIPIGLPATYEEGGRRCDREARRLLGRPRGSSVFSAPPRPALALADFYGPERRTFGLTIQAWNIRRKIAEIDAVMTPDGQWASDRRADPPATLLAEVHPELCFWALNAKRAVTASKRRPEGRRQRAALLEGFGDVNGLVGARPTGVNGDDVLDALAALWTAHRLVAGDAERVPEDATARDERGLRMEIWF